MTSNQKSIGSTPIITGKRGEKNARVCLIVYLFKISIIYAYCLGLRGRRGGLCLPLQAGRAGAEVCKTSTAQGADEWMFTKHTSTAQAVAEGKNATIRAKLFYEYGVMGDINDRSDIYNSREIFITDKCEVRNNKTNISEGGKEIRVSKYKIDLRSRHGSRRPRFG